MNTQMKKGEEEVRRLPLFSNLIGTLMLPIEWSYALFRGDLYSPTVQILKYLFPKTLGNARDVALRVWTLFVARNILNCNILSFLSRFNRRSAPRTTVVY